MIDWAENYQEPAGPIAFLASLRNLAIFIAQHLKGNMRISTALSFAGQDVYTVSLSLDLQP